MPILIRTIFLFTFLLFAGYLGSLLEGWPLVILWAAVVLLQMKIDNNKNLRITVKFHENLRFIRRIIPELAYVPLEDNRSWATKLAHRFPSWIISGIFVLLNVLSGGAVIRAVFRNMISDPVTSLSIEIGFCLVLAFKQVCVNSGWEDRDAHNRFLRIYRLIMLAIVIILFILVGISKR